MTRIGYIPYVANRNSVEAEWLAEAFACNVEVLRDGPTLNLESCARLPGFQRVGDALESVLQQSSVVVEGPGGFLWGALLRAHGFQGMVTILPYLNPRRWYDVACVALYRRFADRQDRIFLGSTPSARIYRGLGVDARVGEPYGIDRRVFHMKANSEAVVSTLGITKGRILLFAGRVHPDKDLYCLLRVGLRAQLLFSDLQIVIASHVVDEAYMAILRKATTSSNIHWVLNPTRDQLADLYNIADVFVTAAISHFETFGRALAEALACGTPVIAPRYDGFMEVLAQPGGKLVDVEITETGPRVNEELLLRAIFDALSTTTPIPSDIISATALSRFDRSNTIQLLSHVTSEGPFEARRAENTEISIALPPAWTDSLRQMDSLPSSKLLSWFWNTDDHERLRDHDPEFVATIRLRLCDCSHLP